MVIPTVLQTIQPYLYVSLVRPQLEHAAPPDLTKYLSKTVVPLLYAYYNLPLVSHFAIHIPL